jgi:hypothetical protein
MHFRILCHYRWPLPSLLHFILAERNDEVRDLSKTKVEDEGRRKIWRWLKFQVKKIAGWQGSHRQGQVRTRDWKQEAETEDWDNNKYDVKFDHVIEYPKADVAVSFR